jgi:hypothetical protein
MKNISLNKDEAVLPLCNLKEGKMHIADTCENDFLY